MSENGATYEEKIRAAVKDQEKLNRREAIRQGTVQALKVSTALATGAHIGAEAINVKNKLTRDTTPINPQQERLLESMAKTSALATAALPYVNGTSGREINKDISRRSLLKTFFVGLVAKHLHNNNETETDK